MWKCLQLEQWRPGGWLGSADSKQVQEDAGDRSPGLPSPHHSFPNTFSGATTPP